MSPTTNSMNSNISPDERKTLEVEYETAFRMFQMQNSQAWQTFQVVGALALGGFAFVNQLPASGTGKTTWPVSIAIGIAMVVILIGWIALARRWWFYAAAELHRAREIECLLGMYLFREGNWLRKPLDEKNLAQLSTHERAQYDAAHDAFPRFPNVRWDQQRISFGIAIALIIVWVVYTGMEIRSLL